MGALIRAALVAGAFASVPAQASPVDRWRKFIEQGSVGVGVPARGLGQVMGAGSGGLPVVNGRPIRSRAGAMGLMQLMPATWATMRARLKLGDNPDDPADNILAGAGFLRLMYDRFGYPGLFAAYNAGPGSYARAKANGSPLPAETQAYLVSVTRGIVTQDRPARPTLFALRHEGAGAEGASAAPPRSSLFAVQRSLP